MSNCNSTKKTLFTFIQITLIQMFVMTVFTKAPAATIADYKIADVEVSGQVKDETGAPLPGVNVVEKGTTNGTVTDVNGQYRLRVSNEKAVLTFSFIGYIKQDILLNGKSQIDLSLSPDLNTLQEIVVVGFGTQKKESLVSSITTLATKDLRSPSSNLTTMMAGRVAGMIAYQRSGEPGADNSDFFIRGLGTFGSGKQNPLILIDGIESSTTDMARLQPDDIESFSVLKDAAAAAIYGARGANGVVLIATKSGKAGALKIDFRVENRLSSNTRNFQLADNITYMKLANEAVLIDPEITNSRLCPIPKLK
jgi:TonB-dependent SusC/RagA subfamily outer membrane receptor